MDQSEPKLTQEELKALRLARKREKKHEKKLLKQKKKKQIKRDHLDREVKYGEITIRKYEKDWKELLTKVALPRMRQELEFAWHNFERVVDCKDFEISLLMDELKQSEEQQMFSVSSHLGGLGSLLDLFDDRLDELREDWNRDVTNLQKRHDAEVEDLTGVKSENFDYLKTMLYQLEVARKKQMRIQKAIYFSKLDECDVKNADIFQKLKAHLEKKYQNMFEIMKNFLKTYQKQIKKKKKALNVLKKADDAVQGEIAQQFEKIHKLQNYYRKLRNDYFDMRQGLGNTLLLKQSERHYFCNSYLNLKNRLDHDKQITFHNFGILSESSAKIIDLYENIIKKGERILNMATICRKLETQKEKVRPFWSQGRGLTKRERRKAEDDEELPVGTKELSLFWQRLGQAYGVSMCLQREKNYLKDENLLFMDTHNDYCEKLGYTSESWKHTRVEGKKIINKIDANFEVQKYTKFQNPINKMLYRN